MPNINTHDSNNLIGIVTLHGYHNYGNKLQNYALQEILKGLDFKVTTIVLQRNKKLPGRIDALRSMPLKSILDKLKVRKEKKLFYKYNKELIDSRTNIFKLFSQKYLCENFVNLDNKSSENIIGKYDYFVTGSDQVWNPIYIKRMHDYFLEFTDKDKRISYAPSFSCSKIPKRYQEDYRNWLYGMSKISVREEEGALIIKELTGMDAPVLVDPTLLLNKREWLAIANRAPNRPQERYILTYFLGEIDETIESYVRNVAREKNMKIIHLGDIEDKETYMTGPMEFIDYINSASIFFTDSFHGVVFSVLLETPFVVYERKTKGDTMYSRIETLLDKFNFKNREAKSIHNNKDIFNIDYSHVPPILEKERNKSLSYLKEALNVKDRK